MRRMLALVVLGVSIALTGATAFAESERGGADHDYKYQAPQVIVQTDPVNPGTFAGGTGGDVFQPVWMHDQEGIR